MYTAVYHNSRSIHQRSSHRWMLPTFSPKFAKSNVSHLSCSLLYYLSSTFKSSFKYDRVGASLRPVNSESFRSVAIGAYRIINTISRTLVGKKGRTDVSGRTHDSGKRSTLSCLFLPMSLSLFVLGAGERYSKIVRLLVRDELQVGLGERGTVAVHARRENVRPAPSVSAVAFSQVICDNITTWSCEERERGFHCRFPFDFIVFERLDLGLLIPYRSIVNRWKVVGCYSISVLYFWSLWNSLNVWKCFRTVVLKFVKYLLSVLMKKLNFVWIH